MGIQDTASKTSLLLECQRPFDPEVETEDSPGEAARYGSAWHEGLALRAQGKPVKPKELAEKFEVEGFEVGGGLGAHIDEAWKQTSAWLKREKLTIIEIETPHAAQIGVNQVFSRKVEFEADGHHYDLKPGEFGGTPDLVLERKGGKAFERVVLDYKSGEETEWTAPHWETSDPKTPQLLTLALIVQASRVVVFHFPKASLPAIYDEKVSSTTLTNFAVKRKLAMARIGDGSLRPGSWCKYCPARESCPAQHAELLEKTTALVKSASGTGLSLEGLDVGVFHQTWSQIEKLVKIARAQIKERVAAGEIFERPDGKVLTLQMVKPYETVSMTSIKEALSESKAKKEIDRLRDLGVLREVAPEPRLIAK